MGRALRLLLTWAALTVLLFAGGEHYSRAWCAALSVQIGWLQDAFKPVGLHTVFIDGQRVFHVELRPTAATLSRFPEIAPNGRLWAETLQAYAHHHLILVFALLVAWPFSRRQAGKVLLGGIPAVVIATSLDLPFTLAGIALAEVYAVVAPDLARESLLILYSNFLQAGGRYLLPLTAALVVVALHQPQSVQNEAEMRAGQ